MCFLLLLLLRSQSFASEETYAFTLSSQLKINSKNIWIVCKEYENTNIFMARIFTLQITEFETYVLILLLCQFPKKQIHILSGWFSLQLLGETDLKSQTSFLSLTHLIRRMILVMTDVEGHHLWWAIRWAFRSLKKTIFFIVSCTQLIDKYWAFFKISNNFQGFFL